jgi:hypothetical protein
VVNKLAELSEEILNFNGKRGGLLHCSDDVAAAAIAAGCDAPRYVMPFPGNSYQNEYVRQLAEIIPRLPRLSGGE